MNDRIHMILWIAIVGLVIYGGLSLIMKAFDNCTSFLYEGYV
jgi:hypothetical protein